MHVQAHSRVVGAFEDVDELARLLDSVLVEFDVAAFAHLKLLRQLLILLQQESFLQ